MTKKNELAEVDSSIRDYRTMMRRAASFAVQDMTIQAARYWARTYHNAIFFLTAKTLKSAQTEEEIDNLIKSGLLPKETSLNSTLPKSRPSGSFSVLSGVCSSSSSRSKTRSADASEDWILLIIFEILVMGDENIDEYERNASIEPRLSVFAISRPVLNQLPI